MGQYVGDYQRYNSPSFPDLPIIAGVQFREGVIRTIEFTQTAVIDTGADISNIPHHLVTQFRLPTRNWEEVFWPDGTRHKCPVYLLKVQVPNLRPITERFIDYGFQEISSGEIS
jgi:hypothetical protein